MRARVMFLVVLAGVLSSSASRVDGAESGDSGRAPAGCWTMLDGCPAGTGAAATPGIRAPFVRAWTHAVEGADARIAEAPRVWHDLVVLSIRNGAKERRLHVLNLSTGRALAKPRTFSTGWNLEPCIWDEAILVREAPGVLGAWRIESGKLERVWEARTGGRFFCPVLQDGFVYALDGGSQVCWRLGSSEPVWRRDGSYRGRIAVRGGDLYVLSVDEAGNIHIVEVTRVTGSPRRSHFIGHWKAKGRPGEGVIASIAALERNVFVQHARDLGTKSGAAVRTSWLRRISGGGSSVLSDNGLLTYEQLPVAAGGRWLAKTRDDDGEPLLIHAENSAKSRGSTSFVPLVSGRRMARFRGGALPLTVAGTIVYAGGRAFDWDTRDVVWDTPSDTAFRPVPAHDTLLVVPSAKSLVALRSKDAAVAGSMFVGPAHTVGTDAAADPISVKGSVFFVDGTYHKGAYEIRPDGTELTLITKKGRRERKRACDLGQVRLLLDAEGRLLYSSTPSSLRPTLERYHFFRQLRPYVKLAKDAYKTYDPDLMARLLQEAEARGATRKELAHPRKQQKALVDRPRKHDAKRRAKILEREQVLVRERAAQVQATVASALDDPRWPVQQAFIRRLLAAEPKHERAVALVRERLPSFLSVPKDFDARQWIDLVDSLQETPVTRLVPPAGERSDLTREEREYGSALVTWRKDLVALNADELLVLTPLAKPGRIAGCLSMGALVCDALEEVFQSGKAVRTNPYPLIMRLYETKKEYLDASVRPRDRGAAKERERLTKSLGHYDPSSGTTRVYLPERPEAWRSVMSTYAHEITHHWIDERCPLFESREGRRSRTDPGYWVVEGMATLLEEFRWDLEKRTWDTENPRAESLDIVANATPKQLIPWTRLYAIPAAGFTRLSRSDKRDVPMRWKLGALHQPHETNMFYAQAAATAHYLYHAGEKERAGLLAYVKAYYTHKVPPKGDTIQAILGIPAEELGRRVLAYAKEQNSHLDDM